MTFVVILEDQRGVHVFGPFRSAARASGFGFSAFGSSGSLLNFMKWRVRPLEKRS